MTASASLLGGNARYTRVAALLHWLIAAFILFNLGLGYFMEGFPPPLKFIVMPIHISGGITVLALTLVRVLWRLTHEPPPHEAGLKPWEKHLAHVVHFLLYCGMVLMPLTGWAILSAHPAPGSVGFEAEQAQMMAEHPGAPLPPRGNGGLTIWWAIPVPALAPVQKIGGTPGGLAPQRELHEELVNWHGIGGYIMIALLLAHVAGALKHQWFDRTPMLQRMRVGRRQA